MLPSSNEGIATTRTTWFFGIVLYLLTIVNQFLPDELQFGEWVVPIVVTVVTGFLYRLALLLAQYKWFGVLLFLINRAPGYKPVPAGEPQPDEIAAPNDRGFVHRDLLMTVLIVLAIAVLIVLLIKYVDINVN